MRDARAKLLPSLKKIAIFLEFLHIFRAGEISRARLCAVVSVFAVSVLGVLDVRQHLPACSDRVRDARAKLLPRLKKIVIFLEFLQIFLAGEISRARLRAIVSLFAVSVWGVLNVQQHLPVFSYRAHDERARLLSSLKKITIFLEFLHIFRADEISRSRLCAIVSLFALGIWSVPNAHQHLPACSDRVHDARAKLLSSLIFFF